MFSRLRETFGILTYRPDAHDRPDVVFVEDKPIEPSRASRAIAASIAVFVLITAVGMVARFLSQIIFPDQATVSLSKLATILGGILGFLAYVLLDRQIHSWIDKVIVRLQITDRLAPYFGNRLTETIRILRG